MNQQFREMVKVTKKFTPIDSKIVYIVPGFISSKVEQEITEEYIDKYGYDNVRGGQYTNSKTFIDFIILI